MGLEKTALMIIAALPVVLGGCRELPSYPDDYSGNFEALWSTIDEHYCFLREKEIDWDSIHRVYAPRAASARNSRMLFDVMASMLDELKDGHTNLSAPFATSYYTKWWSDYLAGFSERLVQQYYFNFNYTSIGSAFYGVLQSGVGYIRYPSFEISLGAGNIDYILYALSQCPGLIFDVRDNGGGAMTNVEMWVNRFITQRTLAGYISHKTGPAHDAFSKPYPYYFELPGKGHIVWTKPVVVLADRSTFSAANNFVSVMKLLPGVVVIGSTTGGGSGMPFSSELPNGWGIRFSACSVLDAEGKTTEFGVEPTAGFEVLFDAAAALDGHDTVLDAAVNYILKQ